jgi:hypothetical protein
MKGSAVRGSFAIVQRRAACWQPFCFDPTHANCGDPGTMATKGHRLPSENVGCIGTDLLICQPAGVESREIDR